MHEVTVSSVSEYINYIEELSPDMWYRGVSKEEYLPLPGLLWREIEEQESALEHHFLVSYKSYLKDENLDNWEIFSLMQHHGLPTRLLDWTESSLVALFFSLTTEPEYSGNRVVWVLNPFELNNNTIGGSRLFCPSGLTSGEIIHTDGKQGFNLDVYLPPNLRPSNVGKLRKKPMAFHTTKSIKRVTSQKGCFTVHGSENKSIDKYIENEFDFQKINIKINTQEDRLHMISTLSKLGIDEEFIYQDLDALCTRIKRERFIFN